MNFDEFEEKLRCQPRREIPPEWRKQILGPLREVTVPWWRQWLWPHPAAWAALAALWIAIFALQVASAPEPRTTSAALSLPGPQMMQALAERTRLMAELFGESVQHVSSPADRPRSGRTIPEAVV